MISFSHRGNFKNTERFLQAAQKIDYRRILEAYGRKGVSALAAATPAESGVTADSWGYKISVSKGSYVIYFTNSNVVQGFSVVIGLQYGHATRNGGYVQGRDFINPALQPIFDKIAEEAWQEVTRL
jgi:hypothetical protein